MTWLSPADAERLEALAPNFKRRLSGVTSTIIQVVPAQARQGLTIATLGPGLPDTLPKLRWRDLWRLWRRPADRRSRVWHARRNSEMMFGVLLRDVLRMPLKLVFTSAGQRDHQRFTKWLIRSMDAVVATSARSGSFLDVPHVVIPHGINTERFRPAADRSAAKRQVGLDPARAIIGCTGRIRASKGSDLLVDALISLLPSRPQWDAVITGRATREQAAFLSSLEQRIAAAGLSSRIRFVGEVEDVLPWYQAFDVFVAPSRNEGFGLTPLEAMACGVPCVTSDAGSYREMIDDGVNGLVVPAGDGAALKTALARMIDDTAFRIDAAKQVSAHVAAGFSLETEAERLIAIYRETAPPAQK